MKKDKVIRYKANCQSLYVEKSTYVTEKNLNEEWHRTASRILFYRKDNFFTDHFAVRLILCCQKSLHWQGFPPVRLTFCSRSTIIPCCQLSFSPVFLLFPAFPFLMFFLTALFLFSSLFSSFPSFFSPFFHSFSEQYYILLATITCKIFKTKFSTPDFDICLSIIVM